METDKAMPCGPDDLLSRNWNQIFSLGQTHRDWCNIQHRVLHAPHNHPNAPITVATHPPRSSEGVDWGIPLVLVMAVHKHVDEMRAIDVCPIVADVRAT